MHSFVTSKNAQWPRLIWPTLYTMRYLFLLTCLYFRSFKLDVAKGGMCRNQRMISTTVPSWNVTWHVSRDSHVTICEVQQLSCRNRDVHELTR